MTVFNLKNDQRKTGKSPLFLGQELGLYDSTNVSYPELFNVYKKLKAQDWSEDEVSLTQDSLDFATCSPSQYDVMIKTLSWQYEADSVACRAIAPLLAPFISNSEYWAGISYITQNEVLHALTYSEITRQCLKDPEDIFKEVENNDSITDRGSHLIEVFDELQVVGAKYTLGLVTKEDKEVKEILVKTIFALYCLEQVSFMASFACTFALAERELFTGCAKLVQKIMLDEKEHSSYGELTWKILHDDTHSMFHETLAELKEDWIPKFFKECVAREMDWCDYIFEDGRSILGLNSALLKEWMLYKATPLADNCGISFEDSVTENPLPWMDIWLNIDKVQNPNQEGDNTNYLLNSITDDIGDDEMDFDF